MIISCGSADMNMAALFGMMTLFIIVALMVVGLLAQAFYGIDRVFKILKRKKRER